MNGPYSIIVTEGDTKRTSVEHNKRAAIAKCKRLVRGSTDGAKGDVRDYANQLVKQVEAYRTATGALKVRDLEL
jgi:hypothetical protein